MANQYTSEHKIKTLPKWAQYLISELNGKLVANEQRMLTVQNMNAVMCEPKRDWFTLPFEHKDDKPIRLWLLNYDEPFPVCDLGKGDLLFVGRARKEGRK